MLYHVPNLLELHRVYLQAIVEPETICVWLHLLTYLIRFIYLLPFSPQISCEWCVIGCARTTGAGDRGLTSASPAGISDEAAPASSPATSSTGEQSVHKHFPAILFFPLAMHSGRTFCTCPAVCLSWSDTNLQNECFFPEHQIVMFFYARLH